MSYQLTTAKVWDGSAWVPAVGGGGKVGDDLVLPYMSDFASSNPSAFTGGANPPPNVTLTANSSAHTFGAWTEVEASTAFRASAIIVGTTNFNTSGTATGSIIEIGTGAAGAESPLMQIAVGSHFQYQTIVPIDVPSGTRIAARIQSVVTGGNTGVLRYGLLPVIGDFTSAPSVDVYGVNTATSRGVPMPSLNTWYEIASSTSRDYRGMCVVLSASNDTMNTQNMTFELGIGASGSEITVGYGRARHDASERVLTDFGQLPFLYTGHIAAGSRIAVKANNLSEIDACVIGIPYL